MSEGAFSHTRTLNQNAHAFNRTARMDLLLSAGANNLNQQELINLSNTHPEFVKIRNYPGVMRIDLEYYGLINSPKKSPIFVVVANSDFTNRANIPPNIEGQPHAPNTLHTC